MQKDIEVKVTFTEGYQRRFTEACLQVLQKRRDRIQQPSMSPESAVGQLNQRIRGTSDLQEELKETQAPA